LHQTTWPLNGRPLYPSLKASPNASLNVNRVSRIFQIYLNNLFGNDFNTIFKLILNFYQSIHQEKETDLECGTKDFDQHSRTLNKGNVYITSTTPPLVYEAYFKQFEKDFKLFLKSRSVELSSSGIMAKLDLFDLPVYGPTAEEVRQVIEAEGSFTIETLMTIKIGWDANLQEDVDDSILDSKMRGEFIAKSMRAVLEPLLSVEFGKDIMDELFSRFAKLVAQLIEMETLLEYTNVVVSMTKDS
ncbi:7-methylxanthosine synthase 1, partial [Mucuna pruriens]